MVTLFSNVANKLSLEDLIKIHPQSKGIKISKGNELKSCPYQVLDVFRDFDLLEGRNIRILHWWGYGMFVLDFFGQDKAIHEVVNARFKEGYFLSVSSDPFDYPKIIDSQSAIHSVTEEAFEKLKMDQPFVLLVKKITLQRSMDQLEHLLSRELRLLLDIGN
ncbi:hypothetical protein [Pararhodonellum marinum]|uniref:hypothetical protein n=1 Tax=Pararhodonellum marinum TaxID=2755358 RepID=UPI00188DE196|nr:hypothetical protein [Pararhodonellum marinum]